MPLVALAFHAARCAGAARNVGASLALLLASGCAQPDPPHLLGGQATVHDATPNAYSQPAPGLEREQELLFFVGNSFFNQNWVSAPASTTARDGLGPLFNARSCAGCHFRDGRGRPPSAGERGTGLLVRLSRASNGAAPLPDAVYGGQLQDQAIPGVPAEVGLSVVYETVRGTFGDGARWELREPRLVLQDFPHGELVEGEADLHLSARVAPHMIGLGLLEAVPESEILSRTDEDDRDGDGISGRPNWLPHAPGDPASLGRFGWKAGEPTVRRQTASAFLADMGITSTAAPGPECMPAQSECLAAPHGGTPEISDEDLEKVVLYASSLAVPAMRNPDAPEVRNGRRLFMESGCEACHTPTLRTGEHPSIPALSNQTIHPYTDLLLHDMGEGLADGVREGGATGSEWRTPPLWGIGLTETVNGHTFYLHDGRARNLTEAILWHGGEAAASLRNFLALPAEERASLIRFLEAL